MKGENFRELESIYYDILLENQYLLQEMFVIGDDLKDYNFIAYKDKIWKIDLEATKTADYVKNDLQKTLKYVIDNDIFRVIIFNIVNHNIGNNEIIFGEKRNGDILIFDREFPMIKDPDKSILFKKIVKELKPLNIKFESDAVKDINRTGHYIRRKNDKIFYHGTTSDHLLNIMRKGLDKTSLNSIYPDKVKNIIKGETFITSNFRYALSHAVTNSKIKGGYPVVISFVVRFEDLLQPDYDVKRTSPNDLKTLKISKEMGIFGYKGNILPTDFEEIFISPKKSLHVDNYSSDDILNIDAQTVYHLMTIKGYTPEELIEFRQKYNP